jgi:hypothetical protein
MSLDPSLVDMYMWNRDPRSPPPQKSSFLDLHPEAAYRFKLESVMSVSRQQTLAALLKPHRHREYRTASVQLLWPPSVKLLVQELVGQLGTSMNELVLRSLERGIAELSEDAASGDVQKLLQNLRKALQQSLPQTDSDNAAEGDSPKEESHAA